MLSRAFLLSRTNLLSRAPLLNRTKLLSRTHMKTVLLVAALSALAPVGGARAQVSASLVAADTSAQPGKPLTVALRLAHEPHWHTYWINAGTGFPTRLDWQLPPGWTAGAITWPTPVKITDGEGDVTGYGYQGVVYFPLTLTPPANASAGEVTLRANARWLMCNDVCIPGASAISLKLTLAAQTPTPNDEVRDALAQQVTPQAGQGWNLAAHRAGHKASLQIAGAEGLQSPYFFSEDAFIQYDRRQSVTAAADGTLTLDLPISADADGSTGKLKGVLAYTDKAGAYHGVEINVPFTDAAAVGASAVGGTAVGGTAVGATTRAQSPSAPPVGRTGAGLLTTVLLALVGGLILNLMPCVFPVLGIKIVGFVSEAGSDRRRITLHGLLFTAGVLLSFWGLAAVLAVMRAAGEQLGWGFQLQSAAFVFGLAVLMLVFALSLSGVFEFGARVTGVGSNLMMRGGYVGSFFTGVLATMVSTPCSAPFLAPALGAALALPTAQSFIVFTAIALGLSAPYLLLSAFPGAVNRLPRPGRWMETFKQVMAFPLYATVAYLIWVLAGQTSEAGLLMALLGLTVIAMAVWLYGRCANTGKHAARMRVGFASALVLFIAGLSLGWPRAPASSDIAWEPWSPARVEELRAGGRPVYVDFTARWCATCQANKKLVFSSGKVQSYFHEHRIATLEADWTNSDPRITAELAKWNRSAVPFNLVYIAGETEPRVLPEVLTPAIVIGQFGKHL
jgi:thiol:disulfide interchange protein/DsbC/DsbD-like thiol-disulfide interchange protein